MPLSHSTTAPVACGWWYYVRVMSSQTGSLAGGNVSFDLNSQSGVMQLLASIRASELSPAQKNELRDLVFLYSNGGGDPSVRLALLKKLDTHKLVPLVSGVKSGQSKVPPPPMRPFGKTRPAPAFAPVVIAAVPQQAAPVPAAAVIPEPVVVVAPVEPVITPPPIPVPPPVQPLPVAPVATMPPPQPIPAPEPEPVPVAPAAVVTPVAVPPPQNNLERIRAIKHAVNQKVGNPVNLVDIDNTVGREYMVALLDAMKKVGGGVPGDIEAAMKRLEEAFVRVEQTVAAHAAQGSEPSPVFAPAPVTPEPDTVAVPSPMEKMIDDVSEPLVQLDNDHNTRAQTVAEDSADRWGDTDTEIVATREEVAVPPVRQPQPLFRAASLADDTNHLLTPNDLPDPTTNSTGSAVGDPLHTTEVDTGLNQLLQEWPIFKKSGLFGTGPKGIAHPLFKELAPLTIPLILAGRYDGATEEIRQSVTDYMNGWRYEQGLVYEPEEAFEHYLRRVIRHIIDLQKRRPSA